jgi:hypothetical protein
MIRVQSMREAGGKARPFWTDGPGGTGYSGTPAIDTEGMLYWLVAASGVSGSNWTSQDPTGKVFSAAAALSVTASALNSRPAVNLSGNHLTHTLASTIAITEATIISVVEETTVAYSRLCGFAPAGGNDHLTGGFAAQLAYSSASEVTSYGGRASTTWRARLAQPTGYYIFETRASSSALRNRTHTTAGTGTASVATGLGGVSAINTLVVGVPWDSGAPNTGYRWGKHLAEQIVWTRALSDDELSAVIAHLRTKYALI